MGIDATSHCNYRSNVDFVHFIWDNFERFSSRKLAITILPSDRVPLPLNLSFALPATTRLVYLQYYRATSDSPWLDRHNCGECILKHQISLKNFCACRRPDADCSCIACTRQPPSLRNICSDVYFRNIQRFKLTTSTTSTQYKYALRRAYEDSSAPKPYWRNLLPPEFPSIHISFRYNSFDTKLHHNCPGEGLWPGQISRDFDLHVTAMETLADDNQNNTFWCSACERGLFFPKTCNIHPN